MVSWLGQYCIYVSDLDRARTGYEALGLTCTSQTDIEEAREAIVENPDKGGQLQLAQKREASGPIDLGNAFWKLYVATNDIETVYRDGLAAGFETVSAPARYDRWPMSVAFIRDPDGYLVELTQRHPWLDGDTSTRAWLNQYCVYVSDIDRTRRIYEALGLECTSQTDIPAHREVILENPGQGGKIQLAEKLEDRSPIDMGSAMWKLYVDTDDCQGLYDSALGASCSTVMAPAQLDRWPVTVAFVKDPDGYLIELVERHPDPH